MIRRAFVLVVFVALACAAAPGAARMPTIAPGVIVGGIYVGDLTSEPARAQLARSFERRIPVVYGKQRWFASPQRLGAGAAIDAAVERALAARPGKELRVRVRWSGKKVQQFVDQIAKQVDRDAVDAELVSVSGSGPVISDAKEGIAVRRRLLAQRLGRALAHSLRSRIAVPTRPVEADRTRDDFGPLIWIDRGSNTLRLYEGVKFVRTFGVATGQSQYPTPSGLWHVVDMQLNPWWRPPDSPWAAGKEPIPPGPGNPLGTRWMGLDASGVGIHGTPDAASIGYSASHGCIRMQIPDAEWLFGHVSIGTPVYIT
jgi:L,D-transpeptidase catalytic domain/Putative peptidoglycan binding domain